MNNFTYDVTYNPSAYEYFCYIKHKYNLSSVNDAVNLAYYSLKFMDQKSLLDEDLIKNFKESLERSKNNGK